MVGDLGNIEADDAGVAKVSCNNSHYCCLCSARHIPARIASNGVCLALLTIVFSTSINIISTVNVPESI
jgi:hypothetical protein